MKILFDLKRDKALKEIEINSKKRRVEERRTALEPGAIDYSKTVVQSTPSNGRQLDAIAFIVEMERDIEYAQRELDNINKDINDIYNAMKNLNDEDSQIYIEKTIYNWSNAKISVKHGGISKWTINRKIKEIEKSYHLAPLCTTNKCKI